MEVTFEGKLDSVLSSEKSMRQKYGADIANALMKRIKQLEAAENFAELLPPLPGKWHLLEHDWQNHWSAHLTGNWRIIVRAEDAEEHERRWDKVSKARVVVVEDPHNKKTRR